MKKYLVHQSIDIAMCHIIEAESLEEAKEIARDGAYERAKIADIQVLNWDSPWDVEEMTHDVGPMSEEEINKWEIIGI